MPAVRPQKRRGLYIHNPVQPPLAIATTTTALTRIRRLEQPLPMDEPHAASLSDEVIDAPQDQVPVIDNEALSTANHYVPCVSGIRLTTRAKRYVNSVSNFFVPSFFLAKKPHRTCLSIRGFDIETTIWMPIFCWKEEVAVQLSA